MATIELMEATRVDLWAWAVRLHKILAAGIWESGEESEIFLADL